MVKRINNECPRVKNSRRTYFWKDFRVIACSFNASFTSRSTIVELESYRRIIGHGVNKANT